MFFRGGPGRCMIILHRNHYRYIYHSSHRVPKKVVKLVSNLSTGGAGKWVKKRLYGAAVLVGISGGGLVLVGGHMYSQQYLRSGILRERK